MRVFVAGGTGAIGRRLVPLLARAGHDVTVIGRNAERLRRVALHGVETVVCDVFDEVALKSVVAEAAPDVVIDQLTDLPPGLNPRRLKAIYERNNRVRLDGGGNLLAAALNAGARRLVLQSSAYWYEPEGPSPKTEESPLFVTAPDPIGEAIRTMRSVEERALSSGLEVAVLRYGMFYGPGTWYWHDGDVGRQLYARKFPMIGRGTGVFSFVHVEDAATATVLALDGPPGVYNVVDDDPAPMAVWLPELARHLNAPPPMRVPLPLARLAAGNAMVSWMTTLQGADNTKARVLLRWEPRYRSWRRGFRQGL